MKLDLFNHFLPREYYEKIVENPLNDPALMSRIVNIKALGDLELRLKQIESIGSDYRQVLSLSGPSIDECVPAENAVSLARTANLGLAELVEKHPGHFPAFVASIPMRFPEQAVAEAKYAITELGARGIQIFTNAAGKPIDGEEYEPLWDLMETLDLPVLLHPARTDRHPDYAAESKSELGLWMTLGWPYETSAAMVRLVYSGVMARHPRLKMVVHHAGAMIPMFWQRVNTTAKNISGLDKTPAEYLKRFYADTALFGNVAGLLCGKEFFGVNHLVFASDAPFGPPPGTAFIETAIQGVEKMGLSAEERERIYYLNACELLNLTNLT